jgi:ATP-dependent helicase/nuclease subunit B
MADRTPHVFTIPASVPFLPMLVTALAEGTRGFPRAADPLALAATTIYLPTRRACRLIRDVFLDVLQTQSAILPRFVPIGDIDEDEIAFAQSAAGPLAAQALDLPDAIEGQERNLQLSRLILGWASAIAPEEGAPLVAGNPASALALAEELARLLDDMTTRKVDWAMLDGLVPDHLDVYWQLTLRFLKIAREHWPAYLAEQQKIEPAERRDRLIAAEIERLTRGADGPVIAAGSTASMPSTAMLLETIARLPQGAVVLPGLDTDLDEASWQLIAGGGATEHPVAGHPQFGMAGLLKRLGMRRADVGLLAEPKPHGRELFVSEALRPAAATERWQERLRDQAFQAHAGAAVSSLSVIEAAHAEDEALAIAAALREAIDDGSPESATRSAALITPDRALARRVLAALERWKVPVDDSGGDPLTATPSGIFARLAAETALGGVEPVALLALLKHPLCRVSADRVHLLECAILRRPSLQAGSAGLAGALAQLQREKDTLHRSDPRRSLTESDFADIAALIADISEALAPLEKLPPRKLSLRELAARHRQMVSALMQTDPARLAGIAGQDSIVLTTLFDQLAESGGGAALMVAPADYAELFRGIAQARTVRRPGAPGARVRIYGPLEARLQHADRVVLGGLVEGVWPPETRSDPWLSRPMRRQLGLDLPERRIGLSAHDFAQALGAPEIFITRAAKIEGAPSVASRFLQRLAALAGEERWSEAIARGARYLQWARALDLPEEVKPVTQPQPRPPREARPRALSVTEIEHWLRDPYTIYARHILKLNRLDPVGLAIGAAERGTAIHGAIGDYTKKFASALPADPLGELLALGKIHFAGFGDEPQARAFWWPRFESIARWFVAWDRARRENIAATFAELRGALSIKTGAAPFQLSAIADRIEKFVDGRFAILDYKTGIVPSDKQVRIGVAPQMTLEGAILRGGGFPGIAAGGSLTELTYVKLKGGDEGGEAKPVKLDQQTPDIAADHALARLTALIVRFDDPDEPYRSLVLPMWKNRYGTYDDLARVKEWSATGGLTEEVGE